MDGKAEPIRLTLPARPENLAIVRQALSGVADTVGVGPATLGDMKMAVTEACTNVILHAYDGPGEIEVEIAMKPEAIMIVVRDEGIGFQPSATTPRRPSRRLGLPLIAALTKRFEIERSRSGPGTEIKMTFERSPA